MSYHVKPWIFRDRKNNPLTVEVCADEAAARKFAAGWNYAADRCERWELCAVTLESPSGRIVDLIVPVAPEVEA